MRFLRCEWLAYLSASSVQEFTHIGSSEFGSKVLYGSSIYVQPIVIIINLHVGGGNMMNMDIN